MYSDEFKRNKLKSLCTNNICASGLYRVARFYNIIGAADQTPARPSDCIDYSILFNSVNSAADLYQTLKKYGLTNITKSDIYPTFNDVHIPTIMHMSSADVYKYYKDNLYADINIPYQNAFTTYVFVKYTMRGVEFVHKPVLLDTSMFLSRAIERNNTVNSTTCILPTMAVYKYYKESFTTRNVESVYKRKPRADKDKPRAILKGMVNTDYYIHADDKEQKKHRLARDVFNDTQGCVLPTWQLLYVMFHSKVRASDKARERINTYNDRCVALTKRTISNIAGSKKKPGKKVNDARIIYAKRHNIKVALYAIIRVQGMQARIIYFNFESDICEDKPYKFANNKITQTDMVKLSRVKDRNIQIYGDKVA